MTDPIPQAPTLERAVLGLLLLEPEHMLGLHIPPETFHSPTHRLIWDAMCAIKDRGGSPDTTLVIQELRDKGNLEKVGGATGVNAVIAHACPTSAALGGMIETLENKRVARGTRNLAMRLLGVAQDGGDVNTIAGKAQALFHSYMKGMPAHDESMSMEELVKLIETHISEYENVGIPTGIAQMDAMIGPLERGSLTFMVGLPGHGKTLVALAQMRRQVIDHGVPCGFMSLEMGPVSLGMRLAMGQDKLSKRELLQTIRYKGTYNHDWSCSPAFFSFDARNINDIYVRGLSWADRHDVQVVYVDHLQEVMCSKGGDSRVQQMEYIVSSLKDLAVRGDLAVVCLAQFNRRAITQIREGESPWYESVRDSERINQSADRMLFLLRDSKSEPDSPESTAEFILKCVKHRNGPIGEIKVTLDYEHQDLILPDYAPF